MRTRRGNPLTSFIIALAVIGVSATFFGLSDVFKDAFASLANFEDMTPDDFRSGDIIHGTITETLGCAATNTETHYKRRGGSTTTTFYYYVVPFFGDSDYPIPEKVFMYRTANSSNRKDLEELTNETVNWYTGVTKQTYTKVTVERAEVHEMSSEEWDAFHDYIDNFIDAFYAGESKSNIEMLKNGYEDAMVPYVVQFSAETNVILIVGLGALGLLALIFIFISVKNRGKTSAMPQYTYIGSSAANADPNLNAPTGLANASDDPYFNKGKSRSLMAVIETELAMKKQQQQQQRELARQQRAGIMDYSRSERPMPPLSEGVAEVLNKRREAMQSREMNFDPYTGKPLNKSAAPAPMEDSMPTVDPKSEENVDLSNGGILPEEKAQPEFVMPFNGAIPVINPDSAHNPTRFDALQYGGADDVTPIHPATSAENMSLDIQVEQTDPSMRGMMPGAPGGEMNSVDPYTEKNVDISNGGIELDDTTESRLASFPIAEPPFTAPEPTFTAPEPPVSADIPVTPMPSFTSMPDFSFPTADPIAKAPEKVPEKAPEPEPPKEPDGYNIFKTDSSSYNIFKTDNKPGNNDSGGGNMGFPVNEKSFPELDKSFPTPGESDVGGQDDFLF